MALSDTYGDSCEDISRFPRLERTGCVDSRFTSSFTLESTNLEFKDDVASTSFFPLFTSFLALPPPTTFSLTLLTEVETSTLDAPYVLDTSLSISLFGVISFSTTDNVVSTFLFSIFSICSSAITLGVNKAKPTTADAKPTPLNFLRE